MAIIKKQYGDRRRYHPVIRKSTGLTHQSFKDDCDINNLIDRWQRTGIAEFTPRKATYADVTTFPDYHASSNLIALAEQEFAQLSLEDQKRFKTPLGLLEAAQTAIEDGKSESGTESPLGVTVPSDTPPSKTSQKGGTSETQKDQPKEEQEALHKDGSSDS